MKTSGESLTIRRKWSWSEVVVAEKKRNHDNVSGGKEQVWVSNQRERELRVSLSKVMIFGEPRGYSSAQSTFIKRVRKRLFVFGLDVSCFQHPLRVLDQEKTFPASNCLMDMGLNGQKQTMWWSIWWKLFFGPEH